MTALVYFTIMVLGVVSAVAGYAGISIALPHDSLWWKLFAALVASAIGLAIGAFWHLAFAAALKPEQQKLRKAAWAVVFGGCMVIGGISAFWHVAALGAPLAYTAAIYKTLTQAEQALAWLGTARNGYRNLLPRLSSFQTEVANLAACEAESGCVTGTAGTRGVYGTLNGLAGKLDGVVKSLQAVDAKFDTRTADGQKCLADLRTTMAAGAEADGGTAKASAAFDCVNAVIAEIDGKGQIERIAQEMDSLTAGLVVPVTIKTDAQKQAVENILASLKDRADAIARDARGAISEAPTPVIALDRMSPMQVVVVHWEAIAPAWATALALDMFPAVLLAFQSIIVASRRELPDGDQQKYTIADIVEVAKLSRVVDKAVAPEPRDDKPAVIDGTARRAGRIAYHTDGEEPDYTLEELDIGEDNGPRGSG